LRRLGLKRLNVSVKLLAQGRFFNANDLSHFGGKTTRASVSTSALKQFCRPPMIVADSLNTQAPLAKIDTRSNLARDILKFWLALQ
jgi:hypothetical protein